MRIIENTWGNCINHGKLVDDEVIHVASVSDLVLTVFASKAVPQLVQWSIPVGLFQPEPVTAELSHLGAQLNFVVRQPLPLELKHHVDCDEDMMWRLQPNSQHSLQ